MAKSAPPYLSDMRFVPSATSAQGPSRRTTRSSAASSPSALPNSRPKSAMPRCFSSMAKARLEAKEMVSSP